MGASLSVAKSLFAPALISLALYLLIFFVIIPTIRRYRGYGPILPLHAISANTSTLRQRVVDALEKFFFPSLWRRRQFVQRHDDSSSLLDEEGDEMVGFGMDAIRRADSERQRDDPMGTEGRLSREIEEGFLDDSDDQASIDRGTRRAN